MCANIRLFCGFCVGEAGFFVGFSLSCRSPLRIFASRIQEAVRAGEGMVNVENFKDYG